MKKITSIAIAVLMAVLLMDPALAAEAASETWNTAAEGLLHIESIDNMTVSSFDTNNGYMSARRDPGSIYVGYAITDGELDEENSNWEGSATDIILDHAVTGEGFTAVRVTGDCDVNLSGTLVLSDRSDGRMVSDFTGLGTAVTEAKRASVNVDHMDYYSEGFGRSFAVIRNSAMAIRNSEIKTMGSDPLENSWDGYYNSASASRMIAAPWVLGILGGIRTINIMGSASSLVITDSTLTAGSWGIVSTDACAKPYLWVFGSTLNILPQSDGGMNSGWKILGYEEDAYGSGYGTYLLGEAREYLYGTAINGATYASILDEGDAYYQGMKAQKTYTARNGDGITLESYTAPQDMNTVIHTVFGFMAHDHGSIHVLDGTVVETAESVFLYKAGNVTWEASGADLHPGNGILLQMMDNDDLTVGGIDPFGTYLVEEPGFPMEGPAETDIDTSEKEVNGNTVELQLSNGIYAGDIYNATGYYDQAPDVLTVTITEDAELDGDIALASHIHGIWLNGRTVDEVMTAIEEANAYHDRISGYYADTDPMEYVFIDADGMVTEEKEQATAIQFTKFSILEYYLMGHVLNRICWNGLSAIHVIVEGTWYVADTSLLTELTIVEGAHVYGEITELPDGSILVLPSDKEASIGIYGNFQQGS